MIFPTVRRSLSCSSAQLRCLQNYLANNGTFLGVLELSRYFTLTGCKICCWGTEMWQREKFTFVYDADGSIGVVTEFSENDFEAYAMPDLALVGAFQTKAQAVQALAIRTHQFRH